MKLDITRESGVTILHFTGEFDAFNLAPAAKEIDALIDAGEVKLVFDVKRLRFINSSALGYLIKARKKTQASGGDVVLVHPSIFLRKTLVTLGLDRMFCIYDSLEDGVGHYTRPGRPHTVGAGDEIDEKLTGVTNVVLFSLVPAVGSKRYVGQITSLYSTGLKFRWSVPRWTRDNRPPLSNENFDAEFHVGRRMRIKFRQPFMAKDHYFEMDAEISSITREVLDDGTDVAVFIIRYDNAKKEDLDLLSRFVNDMEDLRAELDQARTK